MKQDVQDLIHGYLDGVLTADQENELNAWVKTSPANARLFAEAAALHDRLRNVIRTEHGADAVTIEPVSNGRHRQGILASPLRSRRMAVLGAVATLAAVVLFAVWWGSSTPVNAATELERLIETSSAISDRSYLIRNLDPRPEQPEERRPPIDGAALYIRNPNQYALIRRFPDGRSFVTGCDGERSWSIPPDGAVRVSGNPLRFRGAVPGEQHGIPFVNLRSDLVQLRDAYIVTALKSQANGWRGLLAEKKSPDYRGPNRVELWYDARSGVIYRMVFEGLPRAHGGPNSVSVELQEQRDLAADFFRHESHHGPERHVVEEE